MRVYAGAGADAVRSLAAGETVTLAAVAAASADEEDEFDALLTAADDGPVVVTAEVEDFAGTQTPVTLADVQAFHLDADGSGDLAWYAPSEVADVVAFLDR